MNITSFIWNIADDVLRDIYSRGKYRDIILPKTIIRRLDAVLEGTKPAVLLKKTELENLNVPLAPKRRPSLARSHFDEPASRNTELHKLGERARV